MYRRPKFLEELLEIREQMSRESYYDADLFAENVRSGNFGKAKKKPPRRRTTEKTAQKEKKSI